MNELFIRNSIEINAPLANVWEVLINPEITQEYMYGCKIETDWKIGSPLNWRGSADGKLYVVGNLVRYNPKKGYAFTVFDPNGNIEDIPANYLTAAYELEETNNKTLLKISQGDYSKVANGEKRYNDSAGQGGWSSMLQKIKQIAEKNTAGSH